MSLQEQDSKVFCEYPYGTIIYGAPAERLLHLKSKEPRYYRYILLGHQHNLSKICLKLITETGRM